MFNINRPPAVTAHLGKSCGVNVAKASIRPYGATTGRKPMASDGGSARPAGRWASGAGRETQAPGRGQ
jgi:hypothetical protein